MTALYPVKGATKSHDLLKALQSTLNQVVLNIYNISSITSDGAPSMFGKHKNFIKLINDNDWKLSR